MGGYDRSELETDFATAMALLHPDDPERAERAMRAYLSGQTKEYEAEGRFRQKDGSYRWKLARGAALRDAEGRAIRFMISSVDINDLKRAEVALPESEERLGQLDDAASTLNGLIEMVGRLGPQLEELSIDQLRHQATGGGGPV